LRAQRSLRSIKLGLGVATANETTRRRTTRQRDYATRQPEARDETGPQMFRIQSSGTCLRLACLAKARSC